MEVTPSWAAVGIPPLWVNFLKSLKPGAVMDNLIHHMVFRNRRPVRRIFRCACGWAFESERAYDDQTECQNCSSRLLYCGFLEDHARQIQPYSRTGQTSLSRIVTAMRANHQRYFQEVKEEIVNVGWENEIPFAQFANGEKVSNKSHRYCIARAALLCPYLWDATLANDLYQGQRSHGFPMVPILSLISETSGRTDESA